jgi:hypothetical protein
MGCTGTAPFLFKFYAAVAVSGGTNPCANLMSLSAVAGKLRQVGAEF